MRELVSFLNLNVHWECSMGTDLIPERPSQVVDILRGMSIGSSVAEFDTNLSQYFVQTHNFTTIINNERDIISGDKGSGKSAIFKTIYENKIKYKELNDIEVLPAFNISGSPVFQKLISKPEPSEGECSVVWKCYFASLVGNWLLKSIGEIDNIYIQKFESELKSHGLYEPQATPTNWFEKACIWCKSWRPKAVGVDFTASEAGIPVVTPKIEFGTWSLEEQGERSDQIVHLLRLLDRCLEECSISVWVVLDRLDEAFEGYPQVEMVALRSLLRTYLDMQEFKRLNIKLFVRNDLFRKITQKQFVNLTHINAKRIQITWNDKDLVSLICNRFRKNKQIINILGVNPSDQDIIAFLLPPKVDSGSRKSTSINWMLSRIRDGNGVKSPRSLIDFFQFALDAQNKAEERKPRELAGQVYLIEPDALKRAHSQLSATRVSDTLFAENESMVPYFNVFKNGKAEHNFETLSVLFKASGSELASIVSNLKEIGFLEEAGSNFKVPIIYRSGLAITQGKAFKTEDSSLDDDEDE